MSTTNETPESDDTETVQTVQPLSKYRADGEPFLEVGIDSEGKWHWVLWSGNGRQVATNVSEYDRKKDAVNGARAVIALLKNVKMIAQSHEK